MRVATGTDCEIALGGKKIKVVSLKGVCGLKRWDMEGIESVYERWGKGIKDLDIGCGVLKWVKRNTHKWFGHVQRMPKRSL